MNNIKPIVLLSSLILSACGGNQIVTPQSDDNIIDNCSTGNEINIGNDNICNENGALTRIIEYSDNPESTIPSIEDYITLGLQGVTEENLSSLNNEVIKSNSTDIDSKEKLQAIVNVINRRNIVTGPIRLVEFSVSDVAGDNFNNSFSSPLAHHENYLYWIYVAQETTDGNTNYFMKLHQIMVPEEREALNEGTFYQNISKSFENKFGEEGHQLRVLDGSIHLVDGDGNLRFNSNGEPITDLDAVHTAPSVGVDAEGFIHVVGGSHHSRWEYCVSERPNDISDFICPTTTNEHSFRLPPNTRPTYARFFKDPNGKLYLSYRGRFSSHWHNGTSYGALALYDENNKTWTAIGSQDYALGDLLLQEETEAESFIEETGLYTQAIDPKWIAGLDLPETQASIFYSATGAYHRYFRHPEVGSILENHRNYSNSKYAYQAYKNDIKIDLSGRIHMATVVRHTPTYDPNDPGADPSRFHSIRGNEGDPEYNYDEKSYISNYDYGQSILYAYSDDGGKTFHAPNNEVLDAPISPEPLTSLSGDNLRSATIENGAIAYFDKSASIKNHLFAEVTISLDGNTPIIHFREDASLDAEGSFIKAIQWTGNQWEEVIENTISTSPGLISDGNNGLWAFKSGNAEENNIPLNPLSAGSTLLYSDNGANGPWTEIESAWRNGRRIDSDSINSSNVLRYIDMDIQKGGQSSIISLIPPKDSK